MAIASGGGVLPERDARRFHSRLVRACDESDGDCWVWSRKSTSRYGYFSVGGRLRPAHIVSWAVANGQWPTDNLFVLHTCDTPSCVRPEHLYLGTHRQNSRDRRKREQAGAAPGSGLTVRFNAADSKALRDAAGAVKVSAGRFVQFILRAECGGEIVASRMIDAYIEKLTANVGKVGR